jgi:hypothetical protein
VLINEKLSLLHDANRSINLARKPSRKISIFEEDLIKLGEYAPSEQTEGNLRDKSGMDF